MLEPGEENSWLIDLILAFFHSAEWKLPVVSYIDENCFVFDSEDENKLEYTQIHKEFKAISEKLIEAMLAELSASNEDFAKAFEEAPQTEGIKRI